MQKLAGYYISYQRMSSTEQLKGDSLRRQETKLNNFLEKHDLKEAKRVVDIGLSGYYGNHLKGSEDTSKQAGFYKILKAFETEQFDTINNNYYLIIEALDRFSRQEITKSLMMFLDLLNKNVKIITLFDERVYDKNADQLSIMTALVHLEQAHNESFKKSIRLNEVYKNKRNEAKKGTVFTSRCPAWLKVQDNSFHVIEDRAEIIRLIFDKTINENWGKDKLKNYINDTLKIPSFTGKTWENSYITKLLRDRRLIGYFQPHTYIKGTNKREKIGDEISDYYPKVINIADFQSAQEKIKSRSNNKALKFGRNGSLSNLFRGITKCAVCGSNSHLRASGHINQSYLVCSKSTCVNKPVRYEYFEKAFFYLIKQIDVANLLSENHLSRDQEQSKIDMKTYQFRKDEIDKKIKNLAEAIAIGGNIEQIINLINALKKESLELDEKILSCKIILNKKQENENSFVDVKDFYLKLSQSKDDLRLKVKIMNLIKDYLDFVVVDGLEKRCAVIFKRDKIKELFESCYTFYDERDKYQNDGKFMPRYGWYLEKFSVVELDICFAIAANRKLYNALDDINQNKEESKQLTKISIQEQEYYFNALNLKHERIVDIFNEKVVEMNKQMNIYNN